MRIEIGDKISEKSGGPKIGIRKKYTKYTIPYVAPIVSFFCTSVSPINGY